jgi:hypothetical protein
MSDEIAAFNRALEEADQKRLLMQQAYTLAVDKVVTGVSRAESRANIRATNDAKDAYIIALMKLHQAAKAMKVPE